MYSIEVRDLVVRYGDVAAVNGIDLDVGGGEVVALLGPNGAGKTTTVEVLEGYRKVSSGTVRVLGLDPVADHRALTAKIGVMLQRGGVYPAMSPREALDLFASYYDRPEDPKSLLRLVGLEDSRSVPWRRLSGGQQQRLSLALALVGRPDVAFLDEPTAGVDPDGRRAIRDVVAGLRARGAGVLVTTHELDEAERMADRVVIIHHGKVVASGTASQLRAGGAGGSIRFVTTAVFDVEALASVVGGPVLADGEGAYRIDVEATPTTISTLTSWLASHDLGLRDLRAGQESLEDVYLRVTGARSNDELDGATVEPPDRPDGGRGSKRRRARRTQ